MKYVYISTSFFHLMMILDTHRRYKYLQGGLHRLHSDTKHVLRRLEIWFGRHLRRGQRRWFNVFYEERHEVTHLRRTRHHQLRGRLWSAKQVWNLHESAQLPEVDPQDHKHPLVAIQSVCKKLNHTQTHTRVERARIWKYSFTCNCYVVYVSLKI